MRMTHKKMIAPTCLESRRHSLGREVRELGLKIPEVTIDHSGFEANVNDQTSEAAAWKLQFFVSLGLCHSYLKLWEQLNYNSTPNLPRGQLQLRFLLCSINRKRNKFNHFVACDGKASSLDCNAVSWVSWEDQDAQKLWMSFNEIKLQANTDFLQLTLGLGILWATGNFHPVTLKGCTSMSGKISLFSAF